MTFSAAMFSVVSTTGCTIHTMCAWQKCVLSFRITWLPSWVLGFWKVLYVQSPKKESCLFDENSISSTLQATRYTLYFNVFTHGIWLLWSPRSRNTFTGRNILKNFTFCLWLWRKHFIDTFWRPHVSIWWLKKIISVASSRCLPKKVHCGPWIDHPSYFIEDITWWREDMNFMFKWQEQYLTSERSKRVGYCSCHKNIKFISSSWHVMSFLLYKHAADGVFDDFLKNFKDFPKLSQRPDERSRTFSENFRKFPKMCEDCRRLSR